MSKYEKYKASGIDWIGVVPKHWKRKRFRYCFDNGKGLSITKENLIETGIPCVNYGEIHSKYGFIVDPEKDELLCVDEKYLETNQSSLLSNGHFVFADTSEDIEGSGNFTHLIGNHKIFAGYHTIVSRLKINAHPRYVAYFFDSVAYRNQIRSEVQGVKVFSILFFPEFTEQLSIANYLDHQTQKIDRLISNKKAQAEKLKELRQIEINNAVTKGLPAEAAVKAGLDPNIEMKDSGIEWMGEIPEHWQSLRLKHISSVRGRIGFRGYTTEDLVEETEGAITIGATHITSNGLIDLSAPIYISWNKYYESPEIMVELGDLIIVQRGSTVGKVGVVITDFGKSTINPSVVLIRPNKRIDTQYLFFYIISDLISKTVSLLTSSTAIPMISQEQIENFEILLPPISEQQRIVEYLKAKTEAIDKLIKNISTQIEKLQELRKIKIYEAVTGKINVNEYA